MKSNKALDMVVFILSLIIFYILLVDTAFAENNIPDATWTIADIKTSNQSPCREVYKDQDAPQYLCDMCFDFIMQNASIYDRAALLKGFPSKTCTLKDSPFPEPNRTGRSVFIDQDAIYPPRNDDRNYTMGLGLSFSGEHFQKGYLAKGRDTFDGLLSLHTGPNPLERIHTFEYGVTAFTPNDLEVVGPIQGDRPYASLLYVSNSKLTAYNDDYAVKSRLVVGALGLGIARSVQRYLHNDLHFSNQDPLGWRNQISNGGELTALYSVERITLWKEDTDHTRNWDISYTIGANAGYYTDVYAGFDVRVGFSVASPYYAQNANPLSTFNHVNCVTCNGKDSFLFFALRTRAVAYNALLEGQFRENKVEVSPSDTKRLLLEGTVGYSLQITKTYKLAYALNYKSKEFSGVEERAHWFGGLYISKNFGN